MRLVPLAQWRPRMIPWDQLKEYPQIVEVGVGGVEVFSNAPPTGFNETKSVRIARANRTAPSIFTSPAPCSSMLKLASGWAVYIRMAFTMLGVRFGFAWSIKAAAPATTGVDIEVPLRYIWSRVSAPLTDASSCGFCETSRLFGDFASTILLPGATRSGFIKWS